VGREPAAVEAVLAEVSSAGDARVESAAEQLRADLAGPLSETDGRRIAARLALALQASLLVRYAPAPVADAFCATRLGDGPPAVFGLGVPGAAALVDRAAPTR
jgi:putative acyl-CoA dehydrogenase